MHKYGGTFEGLVPELLSKYRNSKSGMQRRQLEKYMRVIGCGTCHGQRLNEQSRSVTLATRHAKFAGPGRPARCRKSATWRFPTRPSSSANSIWTPRAS